MFKKIIKNDIALGLITALLFSVFIYLEYFELSIKIINTLSALSALYLFLTIPKRSILIAGFFIGLLWFYWIGFSFKYNGVGYMYPIITLGFAFLYMLFFGTLAFTNKVYLRAIILFILSFIEPFNWNWMQIEILFVESYIGVEKYNLAIVLSALALSKYIDKKLFFIPIIMLFFAFDYQDTVKKEAPLKIKLVSTNLKQDEKWLYKNKNSTITMNFKEIQNAIKENYDLIVFPETAFPLYMNRHPLVVQKLQAYSKQISIVTGTLFSQDTKIYNVSYFFQNTNVQIAKKLVLVPFGEYVPLPKFAQKFISETFFNGSAGFTQAKSPTDFIVKGVKFRNAICYEATTQDIYTGDVKYIIAISNNAWFNTSIEPVIQNLLMKFYAKKNNVIIYHSANSTGTGIVR